MKTTMLPLTARYALVAIAISCVASSGLPAQDEIPKSDRDRILAKLEKIAAATEEAKFGKFSSAKNAFQAAASSPAKVYEFYLDCYKLVNFDRQGKKFSEFRDWKARNNQTLRESDHATMLQFQLQYLVMTIRVMNMKDRADIIPTLQSYMDAVVAKEDFMGRHARGLRQSVSGTVFAQAYGLDKTLGGHKGWEMAPLNLFGHYQNTILPILRESGTTESIGAAWDRYIKLETALIARREEDVKQRADFKTTRLPSMKWLKWSDVADHGGRARAASEMLALIEANPNHDNIEQWIADLTAVVNGERLSEFGEDQ